MCNESNFCNRVTTGTGSSNFSRPKSPQDHRSWGRRRMTRIPHPPNPATAPVCRLATFETTPAPARAARPLDVKHNRCAWAVTLGAPEYLRYHDTEWGVPVYDDRKLFELLLLASAQSGLSWWTVLSRREDYRRAFADFDPATVAKFDHARQRRLLKDRGIVRNCHKIAAAVRNASHFLEVQAEFGSFARYLWQFVGGRPVQNRFHSAADVPSRTLLSERISHDLKQRGFSYVGPKTVYAYLQAAGLVNDHLVGCFRHGSVSELAKVSGTFSDS